MAAKTCLLGLLDRHAEVRYGRTAFRLTCFSIGVCLYAVCAWLSSDPLTLSLGLSICLAIAVSSVPVSRKLFPGVLVSNDELLQIEREEGWFDKGLLVLFYAKHGDPVTGPLDSEGVEALPIHGSNFDAATQSILHTNRSGQYPINDVCALVEASARLDPSGLASSASLHQLGTRATIYLGAGVFTISVITLISVFFTVLKVGNYV